MKTYDSIDWETIQRALDSKPQMYGLWYGKQCSGFCATGTEMVKRGQTDDSRCPNCHRLGEDAAHLMRCPSQERRMLLKKSVEGIDEWMKTHYTEPELRKVIKMYLSNGGRLQWCNIFGQSQKMRKVSAAQDRIGWRHFTEGKVSKTLRQYQERFLGVTIVAQRTRLTIDSWMKGLVTKLLEMTHSQWIFRCITKHHSTNGTNVLNTKKEVFREIESQLEMGLEALPPEKQWLLEIDPFRLRDMSLPDQQYWLWAVEAAREAGGRALELTEGKTSSWKDVIHDGKFVDLPTMNELSQEEREKDKIIRTNEGTSKEGQSARDEANKSQPGSKSIKTESAIGDQKRRKIATKVKETVKIVAEAAK